MPKVDLWQWTLDMPEEHLNRISEGLSAEEKRRADRFVKPRDKGMFIAGRAKLREILGRYLCLDAGSVEFEYGPHGKPLLRDGPGFNLSHSGGRAVLAVCAQANPGLDIEKIRPIEDAVAKHYFSPAEYAELSGLPQSAWQGGFFRCWTRKEAVLKMLGHGLYMPLDSFDVTLSPSVPAQLTRIDGDDPARWSLLHLEPAPGWVGALALRDAGGPVEVCQRQVE